MKVTGWNNGSPKDTGAGYGIRILPKDRDKFFQRNWNSVIIRLEGDEEVEVVLPKSFWRRCPELRSAKIGKWLLKNGLAPWKRNNPPQLELEFVGEQKFNLYRKVWK